MSVSPTKKGKLPKIPKPRSKPQTGAGKHKHKNDRRNDRGPSKRKAIEEQ